VGARTDSGWGEVAARDDADVGVDAGIVAPVYCAPTRARRATDNRFTCRRLAKRALGRITCAVGQLFWIGQHFTTAATWSTEAPQLARRRRCVGAGAPASRGESTRRGRAMDRAWERGGAREDGVRGHGGAGTRCYLSWRGLAWRGTVRAAPKYEGHERMWGCPTRSVETLDCAVDQLTSGRGRTSSRRCVSGDCWPGFDDSDYHSPDPTASASSSTPPTHTKSSRYSPPPPAASPPLPHSPPRRRRNGGGRAAVTGTGAAKGAHGTVDGSGCSVAVEMTEGGGGVPRPRHRHDRCGAGHPGDMTACEPTAVSSARAASVVAANDGITDPVARRRPSSGRPRAAPAPEEPMVQCARRRPGVRGRGTAPPWQRRPPGFRDHVRSRHMETTPPAIARPLSHPAPPASYRPPSLPPS